MTRSNKEKEAYYFSHDANARNDTAILAMRSVYGAEGYGWYWMIVEILREQADYKHKMTGKYWCDALAMQMQCDRSTVEQFVHDCIHEFDLFECDDAHFWSASLIRRMAKKEEKSKQAKEAAQKRWSNTNTSSERNTDAMRTHSECNADAMQLKERKGKEKKEKINTFFEECWALYPKKKGKGQVSDSVKAKRFSMGDEFKRCIERYKKDIAKNRTEMQYIKNGSTFWNSGYMDYMDEEEPKKPPRKVRVVEKYRDYEAEPEDIVEELPF